MHAASLKPLGLKPFTSRRTLVVRNSAAAPAVAVPVKSADGAEKGSMDMSLKVAGESAKGLVHRYMVMVQQNARRGTASTLTRSEVRGGGRKPYAQKGTGNARRGSTVSPLFPGGGIIFGPKPKDWSIKMNKKERRLALATALQSAAADITVVDSFDGQVADGKTKTLVAALTKLGLDAANRKTLIITGAPNAAMNQAARNHPKVMVNPASTLKIFDILHADKIIIESSAMEHIASFYGPKAESA